MDTISAEVMAVIAMQLRREALQLRELADSCEARDSGGNASFYTGMRCAANQLEHRAREAESGSLPDRQYDQTGATARV